MVSLPPSTMGKYKLRAEARTKVEWECDSEMGLEMGFCAFALREERGRCGDRAAVVAPSDAFRRALKKYYKFTKTQT